MKKAFIFYGGWKGHHPEEFTALITKKLEEKDFSVISENSMQKLMDADFLNSFDLLVPMWTMGEMEKEMQMNLCQAVHNGVGLAGFHGGMGDSFRARLTYEWMTGGHFVSHPYAGKYTVYIGNNSHPVTKGMPESFEYESEQYYMLTDPAIEELAYTEIVYEDKMVKLPTVWTKSWGKGKVFYSALGHKPEEFEKFPLAGEITVKGMLWAAKG